MARVWLAVLFMMGFVGGAVAQTGPCSADDACKIDEGSYHLMAPPDWDGQTPLPVLVFFHGFGSSGRTIFNAGSLKSTFLNNGYIVVGPNGSLRPGSNTRFWPARPNNEGFRDDVAFTRAVVDDVAARLPVQRDRVFVTGFSAGGSMAWMVACYDGANYAGFVSVAGALRRPVPAETCPAGPVRLLQIHGFADGQVPIEGRAIGNWHQGDVFESMNLLRNTNQCRTNPDEITIGDRFRCRDWSASCGGGAARLCIHDGGHGLPRGWSDMAKTWLETPFEPSN
ncbi:alpha/beta hydrolase family esterase [Actibacterium mucosum]|uniref:alpha/beta hydrolase family esterase n=1 Tax=Actibacterium mucosum TaxID=1087332 RepID=UPI0009DEBD39|nr:PHB depolymerase family esterase [Actibacterium mucosum]